MKVDKSKKDFVVESDEPQVIEFETLLADVQRLLKLIKAQKKLSFKEALNSMPKVAGIYVLYENDKPVYVGRTRNLRSRLRGHVSGTASASTYAFLLAREKTGKKASYTNKGSRSDLLKNDKKFKEAFDISIEKIRKMSVNYVEVANDSLQYFLEFYVAVKFKTKYNKFRTT